jgi:putative Mg2+ transporter-C (MgtC) family protein
MELDPIWRIALAMALGGLLGLERELANKPAGLRTNMLVAGAAALLVCLGNAVVQEFDRMTPGPQHAVSDPLRIIEAVITGVSFLGAGTIIRRQGDGEVEGLTTAASMLMTAGVGVAIAVGHLVLALATTGLVLLTLRLFAFYETRAAARAQPRRRRATAPEGATERS